MSEWHGKLKVGSIETNVSFVGGTASPSGSQPAYMTTKDPIVQFVIENSKEYKEGFIIRMLTQEVAGVHPRMAVAKPAPTKQSQKKTVPAPIVEPVPEAPAPAMEPAATAPEPETTVPADETPASNAGEGTEVGEGEAPAPVAGGVQTVEVACKADAVEWLKERYPDKGYNGNTLRSKDAFAAACKEAGVEFIFANA